MACGTYQSELLYIYIHIHIHINIHFKFTNTKQHQAHIVFQIYIYIRYFSNYRLLYGDIRLLFGTMVLYKMTISLILGLFFFYNNAQTYQKWIYMPISHRWFGWRMCDLEPLYKAIMMTSSNGNIFRVTGHLCGEFTGPRWIPRTKASDAELCCFHWSAPE